MKIIKILNRIRYKIYNRIFIKNKKEREALNNLGPPWENIPQPKIREWTEWDEIKHDIAKFISGNKY